LCDRRLVKASLFVVLAACHAPEPPAAKPQRKPVAAPAAWPVPTGWKSEVIPFPLDFAPKLPHRGVEELRFAPGMFDPSAAGYWSYAFVWRTDDAAQLDAAAVGAELTDYFRGLIDAVDDKKRIADRDAIVAKAEPAGDGKFRVTAHVFDAFKTALPVDLVGTAERKACGTGALWIFALAPATSGLHAELDKLAAGAECNQPVPAKP
jgi:hypothetical protein